MQETRVWSLGQEDTLEKGMATHFSTLAWIIPMDRGAMVVYPWLGCKQLDKFTSASLITLKPLHGSQQTVKIFQRDGNSQTTLPASWETCMQVKKQQVEPDMKQWTGSKLGKEYIEAMYCHPAYLTSMQSISLEIPSWMKHKLELIARRNINNLRYAGDTILMQKAKRN